MDVKKFAIMFSGNGTNMEVLINKLHNKIFNNTLLVCDLLICNNKNAFGIIRAKNLGFYTDVIPHTEFNSKEEFEKQIVEKIKTKNIDLVILAGFMRILSPVFTNNVKAINVHPSILPLFKGANGIKDSYYSGMKLGGASVHFVTEELDSGDIIFQRAFEKKDGMSLEEWEEEIHKIEHEILPLSVIKILTSKK